MARREKKPVHKVVMTEAKAKHHSATSSGV